MLAARAAEGGTSVPLHARAHTHTHRLTDHQRTDRPNMTRKTRENRDRSGGFRVVSFFKCCISLVVFTGVSRCDAVQVSVRDERRFAMLFQSVVLPCHYTTVSTQTPVIQWWYKSYCRDRTRDIFRFPVTPAVQISESGSSVHLDCGDSERTVRIVASGQGSSITLSEYYKGRDISIINKANLRIGELQWGDSGLYYCKVVISDDLEGQNEAHVELLVLGQTRMTDDLLPGINMEIIPEWVFVCVVVIGSIVVILLVGLCWCQCCPHSCCCYVRCCCCPDSCCCPRHLYEAGKGIKTTPPTPVAMYPTYYIPGMPTMMPIAPPSLVDPHLSSVESNGTTMCSGFHLQPASDQNSLKVLQYVEKQLAEFNPSQTLSSSSSRDTCGLSELSSLHDVETDFRQTYRQVQKKALPAIPDLDDVPDLLTSDLSASHEERYTRQPQRRLRETDDNPRWKPRSEHLKRKPFLERGRTGSLDELEELAMTCMQRGRRHGDSGFRKDDYRSRDRERELELDGYPMYCSKRHSSRERPPSPPPLPGQRPGPWENNKLEPDPREYDDALLNMECNDKAGEKGSYKTRRTEEGSDSPSKNSSKKSHERLNGRSPSNRSPYHKTAEHTESLPPYTEKEHSREAESTQQPLNHARSSHGRQEEHNRPRKVSTLLGRDTLIV
ncbi:immunoglobulin-like domain-containing receptor 2 isoform X4 [Triplophysa dalaica]|uniref:immunoglobulin-like domain-containing receptor 2 isoform X4 n=1 Tax=Triplophysa dalaica TaxID=1582913 RepID=UPI0024DFC0F5|nr:immunoglobulin-like domain-containing receptor 2 isoform X4 [Triplophysa dalaica]